MTLKTKRRKRVQESLWDMRVHLVDGHVVKYIGPVVFEKATSRTLWCVWQGFLAVHAIRWHRGGTG